MGKFGEVGKFGANLNGDKDNAGDDDEDTEDIPTFEMFMEKVDTGDDDEENG